MYKERERKRDKTQFRVCVDDWTAGGAPHSRWSTSFTLPPVLISLLFFVFDCICVSVCMRCDGDVDVGIIGFVTRTKRETNLAT